MPARAAFAPLEESKVVSSHPFMFNARHVLRAVVFAVSLSLFVAAHPSSVQAQDFTLTPSALSPPAGIAPGGTATATITLSTTTGFANPVAFTCIATSTQVTTNLPICAVTPNPQTPNAIVSLSIATSGATLAGQYTITVTGTSALASPNTETAILLLNVVGQGSGEDYTLTVSKPISPTTVSAGSGAEATVTVTPIGSYTGNVTLSCFSVTPVVTASPICAFNPPTVAVTSGAPPTSVLTVSTYGPTGTNSKLLTPRIFYALWLAFPAVVLMGVCSSARRRRNLLGLLLLMAVAEGLLFLPSCGGTSNTLNNPIGLTTPKNTYTFTLTGVDANGAAPSNTTTNQTTVALTVN
jgi:hypothetical protein